MIAHITPRALSGSIPAIPSKSYAQRYLIAELLSGTYPFTEFDNAGEDIEATLSAVKSLHAGESAVDCGSSATAARILLQVLAVAYPDVALTCSDQLQKRPLEVLIDNPPQPGVYEVSGSQSSQYISGLMFALPLLEGDSTIALTSPLESSGYVDMTIEVLRQFGIDILPDAHSRWRIPGNQRYRAPSRIECEGDWSNAPVWLAAGAEVTGLSADTLQPDGQAFLAFCARTDKGYRLLPDLAFPAQIDVSQCPDLTPVLAVMAATRRGQTRIVGTRRLRIKESDRIASVVDLLTSLGGVAHTDGDDIVINGSGKLEGGTAQSYEDHRIVMAATLASRWCAETVTIVGCEAVAKSYPRFFDDFVALGGHVEFE